MRIFNALLLTFAVSACNSKPAEQPKTQASGVTANVAEEPMDALRQAEAEVATANANDGKVVCAVSGATVFARVCEIERNQTEGGLMLTIRHPDGGFRRLMVVKDGRGVIAADGAEAAVVKSISAREIEVSIADNHYRLPATVKGAALPAVTKTGKPG